MNRPDIGGATATTRRRRAFRQVAGLWTFISMSRAKAGWSRTKTENRPEFLAKSPCIPSLGANASRRIRIVRSVIASE